MGVSINFLPRRGLMGLFWKPQNKGGAFKAGCFHLDASAIAFDDVITDRKTDARSWVSLIRAHTALKNALLKRKRNTWSIVFDDEKKGFRVFLGFDLNGL